ncbi:MAG: ammonia-dependent NAD(+) synthetase [Micrococcaceae bacterium]|nr:ammonia-dependent NAD(+) synthetase [Micrococcaceae bacterium]
MRELQAVIIKEMGVKPQIDPAAEVRARIDFLKEYLTTTATKGFVLGISGGLDSTLAGRLAQLAVEQLRAAGTEATFVAVRLPYGTQLDESDAQAAMEFVAADVERTINIESSVDGLESAFREATASPVSDFNKGNIKARMRMIAQYTLAGEGNLLVIGTDHGAESVTGFFTKFGDGAADLLPLYGLNKRQNRELLRHLGASKLLWEKVPTADLLDGQPLRTDEDELGITYEHIDDYLEGREIPEGEAKNLEGKFLRSRHKRITPASPLDSWWRD